MQLTFFTRSSTFALWLLIGGCAVYWGLKFIKSPAAPALAMAQEAGATTVALDSLALAKGLGGGQVAASEATSTTTPPTPSNLNAARFVLTGVAVSRVGDSRASVALIGVDGKPARPYRVGASLTDGVVLHSVRPSKAMLSASSDAPPSLTLELPPLTSAVAGTAVAARPQIPAPLAAAAIASTSANASALPSAALGSRPARSLANRQQEALRAPPETQTTQ